MWPLLPGWFACPKQSQTERARGTYAWRVMRGDQTDLKRVWLANTGDIQFTALQAIHKGSKGYYTSPFLHASLSRDDAVQWLNRAREGYGPLPADPDAYLVMIDLAKIPKERVIDLSSHEKQKQFLGQRANDDHILELIHQQKNPPMTLAEGWKEVLILGRGWFVEHYMERARDPFRPA